MELAALGHHRHSAQAKRLGNSVGKRVTEAEKKCPRRPLAAVNVVCAPTERQIHVDPDPFSVVAGGGRKDPAARAAAIHPHKRQKEVQQCKVSISTGRARIC